MCPQRIERHELVGDLAGKRAAEAALHIDFRQLIVFPGIVHRQALPLQRQIGALRIGLRTHRHILAGGHGHGARRQPGDTGQHDAGVAAMAGRNAEKQARGRNDTVIGAQHRGAQPADPVRPVKFLAWHRRIARPDQTVSIPS